MSAKPILACAGMVFLACCFSISKGQPLAKDTSIADNLYQKSKEFWASNIDSARVYLRQSNELAKKIGYLRGEAYAAYGLGATEKVLYKQFQYYTRSMEIFENLHDKFGVGLNLVRIGSIYIQIGQPEKAMEYYQRSLTVKKAVNDFGGVALTLISMGRYHLGRKEYQQALNYFKESLVYRHKEGTHQGIAYAQTNMASAMLELNNVDQAASLADSALYHFSFTKDPNGQVMARQVKGETLLRLGKMREAEKYFTEVVYYPSKLTYTPSYLAALKKLSEILGARGDLKKAFQLQSQYLALKDSLLNQDYRAETQRIANEFEFKISEQAALREKELRDQEINRRYTMEYISIAIVVVVLFTILFSGRKKISDNFINTLLLIGLLMLFEFLLVLTDSPVENITKGEPVLKLLANVVLALLILPGHQFLEKYIQRKLLKSREII